MGVPIAQARAAELTVLLTPILAAQDVELDDVDITAAGRRQRIQITVDSDRALDLDLIAAISQLVSAALDDNAVAGRVMGEEPYVLEVSTRGVDRPLLQPRQWRRNIGRRVECVLVDGSSVTGRIAEVSDAVVEVRSESEKLVALQLIDIASAVVQVDFTRANPSVETDAGEAAESSKHS